MHAGGNRNLFVPDDYRPGRIDRNIDGQPHFSAVPLPLGTNRAVDRTVFGFHPVESLDKMGPEKNVTETGLLRIEIDPGQVVIHPGADIAQEHVIDRRVAE